MIYIFGAAFDPPHAGHNAIIRALLHYRKPEKIVLMPSGKRDDKSYNVSDAHRKAMVDIFVSEIHDSRVVSDYYFLDTFTDEMITRDVDVYAREKYADDIIHVFGTDTIASMPDWDEEQYAAKKIQKLFVPRGDAFHFLSFSEGESLSDGNRSSLRKDDKMKGILNYELFTDSHFPPTSSTEVRQTIPQYTGIERLYEKNPKFIIPGLSKQISKYILEKRLYRGNKMGTDTRESSVVTGFLPPQEGREQDSIVSSVCVSVTPKPKVLVHVCCGPDVTMPILQLKDEYDILCFWYDPNIEPKAEYDKRFEAFEKVCKIENIPYIKGAYDVKNFHKEIAGLEDTPEKGEKCTKCYDMRLRATAKLAKKLGIKKFTTSLNTSPKKDLEKIFTLGHGYAEEFGLEFLAIPFRKGGGFDASVAYTRKHDIYRQNYCGCAYSIREGGGRG